MPNTKPGGIGRAILENAGRPEHLRLSVEQLAAHLGVQVSSVHERMSRLRRAGRLAPSQRQLVGAALPMPDRIAPKPEPHTSAEGLLRLLERGDILTPDQRKRGLSDLAVNGPVGVRVPAYKALHELDPPPPGSTGPREPLDRPERLQRIATMLAAVGPDEARLGLEVARVFEWDSNAIMGATSAAIMSASTPAITTNNETMITTPTPGETE
jgi:DNA-binding Lrp family transcriptional regulator